MVTENDIIVIKVPDTWRAKAEEVSLELGALPNSTNKGSTNVMSLLGEFAAASYLGTKWKDKTNYDYDILIDSRNARIDVKSKYTEVMPEPNFAASVWAGNPMQKTNYYLFTRVLYDHSAVFLCGYLPKLEFIQKAKYLAAGEIDPDDLRYKAQAVRWNTFISELNPMSSLLTDNTVFINDEDYWNSITQQVVNDLHQKRMIDPDYVADYERRRHIKERLKQLKHHD